MHSCAGQDTKNDKRGGCEKKEKHKKIKNVWEERKEDDGGDKEQNKYKKKEKCKENKEEKVENQKEKRKEEKLKDRTRRE
jgi:hypothetical protein